MFGREEPLSERIKRKLRCKSRAELLDIFKREVLNLGNNKFWDEFDQILADDARVQMQNLRLRASGAKGKPRPPALIRKTEILSEMLRLSEKWKEAVKKEFGTIQKIGDNDLIDAITEMRLNIARLGDIPFSYERYMKGLYKGRQKGRPYKTFYEH